MLKIFSKNKTFTDILCVNSLSIRSFKLYQRNKITKNSFVKNKLKNIFKSFDIYKDLRILKDEIKYHDFRKLFENKTCYNQMFYKELNYMDISQYFNGTESQFITFPDDSSILLNFRNSKEEFLIENKIFLNKEMKLITHAIERDIKNTNLTNEEANNAYQKNRNSMFAILGPLGSGKSILLKFIRLYFIESKFFVLYFDKINSHKNYITKFIEEVVFGFHRLLVSDISKSDNMEIEIIRDLYELYYNVDKEALNKKEIFEQLEKIIIRLDKIANINRTKIIIVLDHLIINKQDNNDLLELILNNRTSFVVVATFYDNFSLKNFLDCYEGKIPIKKLYVNYDIPMTKQLIQMNGIFLKYLYQFSVSQWNRMIKEFIDRRYFFDLKSDISKDFSFISLIEYYTKLNPFFLNRLLHVMKEELDELENEYVILDLIIDSYEYKEKIFVRNLIHDYITFQISKEISYNKLLEALKMFMQSQSKFNNSDPKIINEQRGISEMVCDNFIFYSISKVIYLNIPFVFEILSKLMKKNN